MFMPRGRDIAGDIGTYKKTAIKKLNIYLKSGLFRANSFCILIIISCLRDYF